MSISSTRLPRRARPAPKLAVVVVLPTPPFWLMTAQICTARSPGAPEQKSCAFRSIFEKNEITWSRPEAELQIDPTLDPENDQLMTDRPFRLLLGPGPSLV